MAWECAKCGHKSGRRIASSYGCDHEWWDEDELAEIREKEEEEWKAERTRELLAFNDELLNTEKGQKLLSGEEGWSWLLETKKGILWLNSSFGIDWMFGKSGKAYLDHVHESVLAGCENKQIEEIESGIKEMERSMAGDIIDYLYDVTMKVFTYANGLGKWLGIEYLKTELGKQWAADLINELKALVEEKKRLVEEEEEKELLELALIEEDKKNRKLGCGCLIIIIVVIL